MVKNPTDDAAGNRLPRISLVCLLSMQHTESLEYTVVVFVSGHKESSFSFLLARNRSHPGTGAYFFTVRSLAIGKPFLRKLSASNNAAGPFQQKRNSYVAKVSETHLFSN